jgi:hypothetical protein
MSQLPIRDFEQVTRHLKANKLEQFTAAHLNQRGILKGSRHIFVTFLDALLRCLGVLGGCSIYSSM